MPHKKVVIVLLGALTFLTAVAPVFAADKEKVLYSFCSQSGCSDGRGPIANLVFDAAGNLYGTTTRGGPHNPHCNDAGCGTAFLLTPGSNGTWSETVLFTFDAYHGWDPYTPLVLDAAGNLYGTALCCDYPGGGAVYKLLHANGAWKETVLARFACPRAICPDGDQPSGVILGAARNLYGTTAFGGENNNCAFGCGTAFALTRANGGWTVKVVHNFGEGKDGYQPGAGPISDAAGNLYGTTQGGGAYGNAGTVFQLTSGKNGSWSEKVLHSFNGQDGDNPQAVLVLDAAGNLYGTAIGGGTFGGGVAFELVRGANGKWTRKILHNFGNGSDGAYPSSELVFDSAGNLYGTTDDGGDFKQGTAFELTPGANGGWTEKVLHSFGNGKDGAGPGKGMIFDASGNLYGTTLNGGAHNGGTVYKITP